MQQQINHEFIASLHAINDPLIPHGRFVSPALVQNQYAMQVESLSRQLNSGVDDQTTQQLLGEINQLISIHWFHPLLRSFYCHRAAELPYVQEFSHLLERANLHYFRQDYLSAVMILVPVIEGIILRHSNSTETKWKEHKKFLEALTPSHSDPELTNRMEHYREFLVKFLSDKFFCNVAQSNTALNRHKVLHMLGNDWFYDIHSCQTLFQLIDLYIELIACQTNHGPFYCWIHEEVGDVQARSKHYWSIILNNYFGIGDYQVDESFLKTHNHYKTPSADTNYLAIQGQQELLVLTHALLQAPEFLRKALLAAPDCIEERRRDLLLKAAAAAFMVASH